MLFCLTAVDAVETVTVLLWSSLSQLTYPQKDFISGWSLTLVLLRLLVIFGVLKAIRTSPRSTSRSILSQLPLRPRSSRLSGPPNSVRTSTPTTTSMQRLSLLQFSPSRLLLRLTARSLLTSLTVLPQLPVTGHAHPVSSLIPTVTRLVPRQAAPDFTGTVSEWYETLVETINDVSAQIHRKTLRGGANFVVCGPEVANILEFTAGFRASVTHDDEKGSIGALRVGSLSKKFDVIVDPYFLRNVILVGRRGALPRKRLRLRSIRPTTDYTHNLRTRRLRTT